MRPCFAYHYPTCLHIIDYWGHLFAYKLHISQKAHPCPHESYSPFFLILSEGMMWEITNPLYSSSCIFVNPPTHPKPLPSAHIALIFKQLKKITFVIRLTLALHWQKKRLPICMPQHAIFWLSIALFMLGFTVKYKLEHPSMSSGTPFHINWNTLPHHLEQCYMLVKPNQKMLELHVKG